MTVQSPILDGSQRARLAGYTDLLSLVERLHRLILDVIKDEFERLGVQDAAPQLLPEFHAGHLDASASGAVLVGLELDDQRPHHTDRDDKIELLVLHDCVL